MSQHVQRTLVIALICCWIGIGEATADPEPGMLREVNALPGAEGEAPVAIVGGDLFDGRGGPVVRDAAVVIEGERIVAAGPRDDVTIPPDADIVDAEGFTVMPGLIDSHLHATNDNDRIARFLRHGVTTMRDPGHPFRFYQSLHFATEPMPRVFLTGAHLDGYPGVWRQQAVLVRDDDHARQTVHEHVDAGASAIKIYFLLPLERFEPVCEAAAERAVPVVAHLELVDADAAIRAGVEGIEHVTSFGTALADPEEAERFRAALREDPGARREERFRLWASLDLEADRVQRVIETAVEHEAVLSPTLALFERREGERNAEDYHVRGYENMRQFVGMCYEAGVQIAVGSHSWVPFADRGWAYQREMEVLVEAGMSPEDVLLSSTAANARYFRAEQRLGTVEPGKLADLLLIEGDPTEDIAAMYDVHRVMLNGRWLDSTP